MEVVWGPSGLAHIPFIEIGDLRRKVDRAAPARVLERGQRGTQWCPRGLVAMRSWGRRRRRGFAMDLHVLAQGARMCVRLVTASDFAEIWLVTGVDMRVFLSVTAIGKLPVAAIKFTFKRLLS